MQLEEHSIISPFKANRHRHKICVQTAMDLAKQHCKSHGIRLTPLRKRVIELIWANHKLVKAYDLLDQLKQEYLRIAPPTIYRTLDVLRAEGIVHKLETLNAYIGCGKPDSQHVGQFMICRHCYSVAEMASPDISEVIAAGSEKMGFTVEKEKIELIGCCKFCRETHAPG